MVLRDVYLYPLPSLSPSTVVALCAIETALVSNPGPCASVHPPMQLWATCNPRDERNGVHIYTACNNANGLHVSTGNICAWDHQDRNSTEGDGLEVWIDVGPSGTASPTAGPTRGPTNWYQHADHRATIEMLQTTVGELETTVRGLSAQLVNHTFLAAQLALIDDRFALVDDAIGIVEGTMAETIAATVRNITEFGGNVTELGAGMAELRAALVAAVQHPAATGSTRPATAAITAADDGTLLVAAPSVVNLKSATCTVDDLCEVAATAARLAAALDQL